MRSVRPHRAAAGLLAAALMCAAAGVCGAEPLAPALTLHGYASGEVFQLPGSVAFDPRDGAIYVANTAAHRIEIFSRTGRPLGRFVHRATLADGTDGDGRPSALAFDRTGRLLVADQASRDVDVLDRRGRRLGRLEVGGGQPSALAVAVDGTIYVGTGADSSLVVRFDPRGNRLGAWGEAGAAPGHLGDVTALAVLPDGNLAVACSHTESAVQIFTPEGRYLSGFGAHEMNRGDLSLPTGLAATADGRIWVTDAIRQDLQVYDREGRFIETAGGSGSGAGQFSRPGSLSFDGVDRMAVADQGLGRVQVLTVRPGGRLTPASEH